MRDLAKLLFGDGPDRLLGLFGPGDSEESRAVERVRRSGEWCGSTPGRGSAADAVSHAAGHRGGRHPVTRDLRDW